ncbi:hypothetical protein [Sphingomonas immobilis]|uniref:Secreted protein n=1 Tax=Sphingomonas immobilis TaxID=3063997 RepID=A0ABT8ZVI3_9SPHN|nr:hypothetical protein [Sphingomonas sp. CA1-15]MDO7841576.1 hypothetical protein [Sphingomonas sp. CA1-15]
MLKLLALMLAAAVAQQTVSAQTGERATDADDKVICKRFTVTGSLVASRKECKTKREWETDRANLRAQGGPAVSSCQTGNGGTGCS